MPDSASARERVESVYREIGALRVMTRMGRFNQARTRAQQVMGEMLRAMLVSDPHSPARFRVIGVLRNFTPFYEAFGVSEGDGMYLSPAERVAIW